MIPVNPHTEQLRRMLAGHIESFLDDDSVEEIFEEWALTSLPKALSDALETDDTDRHVSAMDFAINQCMLQSLPQLIAGLIDTLYDRIGVTT